MSLHVWRGPTCGSLLYQHCFADCLVCPGVLFVHTGSCGHDFCMHCISAWKDERQRYGRSIQCPVCRAELLASPSQSFGECHAALVLLLLCTMCFTMYLFVENLSVILMTGLHPLAVVV